MKLQIAFDYLMVFVFVVLIFTFLLLILSNQRGLFSQQQSFAQLQVIAQSIAGEINTASQAGNGYNATIYLPAGLSLLQYNVSITKYGAVIISSNVLGQNTHVVAQSSVLGIISNSTYLSGGGLYYNIPTYNGSGSITLQNSFGVVCVDYSCPTTADQPAQLTVRSNITHALSLNGYNSYVYKDAGNGIAGSSQSVAVWFRESSLTSPGSDQALIDQGSNVSPSIDWMSVVGGKLEGGTATSAANSCTSSISIQPNTWYFAAETFGGGVFDLYINGSATNGCSITVASSTAPKSINIGQNSGGTDRFNGTIADVQSYNQILSPTQILKLYDEGIAGGPINNANVVLWVPLDGNANDYGGGHNNPVQAGPSIYPTVAQFFARALSNQGAPVSGAAIGVSSTMGSFINGSSSYQVTNGSGSATTLLNQKLNNGLATVKETVFNGNQSTSLNETGWWPLNLGQGSYAYDIGGNSNAFAGSIVGASWAAPNYVASFDGQSSYIQIPNNPDLQLSSLTISAWVNFRGVSAGGYNWIAAKQFAYSIGACGYRLVLCYYDWGTATQYTSRAQLAPNTWYLVTSVINGVSDIATVYVNGVPVMQEPVHINNNGVGLQLGYGNCCQQLLNGSLSNVQVYSSQLSQQQILQIYQEGMGGTPIAPQQLVAWWPLDGDANDYSGNGNNGTIYGNLQMVQDNIAQVEPSHLLAGVFNGNGGDVTVPTIPNSTTGNITVGAWVNYAGPNSGTACQGIFGSLNGSTGYQLEGPGGCGYVFDVNGHGATWPSFDQGLPVGKWTYIVATYNGKSGNESVYLNNILFASGTLQTNLKLGQSAHSIYYIGNNATDPGSGFFNGGISNLQVYGSVLTQPQISSLYSEGLDSIPVQGAGLLAWYPLDGDSNDYSAYGNSGTAHDINYVAQSVAAPYATPSISGYGLYFNGQDSNVVVSRSVRVGPTLTVSGLVDPVSSNNIDGTSQDIIGEQNAYLLSVNADHEMEADFDVWVGGSEETLISPFSLNTNAWYSITGSYNGKTIVLYVNGIPVNSLSDVGSITNPNQPTVIGSSYASPFTDDYFNGTIANLQVYNAALTPLQVGQLYDSGLPLYATAVVPMSQIT